MSIETKIDLMSHDLINKCLEQGWWVPNEQFNWKKVIGEAKLVGDPKNIFPMILKSAESRYASGLKMLKEKSEKGNSFFNVDHPLVGSLFIDHHLCSVFLINGIVNI